MDNFGQIAITAIGVLGSASIWKYFESRLKVKAEQTNVKIRTQINTETI